MAPVLFRNVRPHGGPPVDLSVDAGRIAALGVALAPPRDAEVVDGHGALVLPALVDAHIHPDKTAWGQPWFSRMTAASIAEFIGNDVASRSQLGASVEDRATALMAQAVSTGTRAMRAHVDIASAFGLANLAGVRAAADRLRGVLDVQIVAFPQLGLMTQPGTAALLEAAVSGDADLVGGLDPIGIDGDLHGHLDVVFGIAERQGVGVDIHLHDGGSTGIRQIEEIVRRTRALAMAGMVNISHAFCVADSQPGELARICEQLAAAGVSLATCALGDAPVIPIAATRALGVRVALGSDGVRDSWTPFGNADMLERTHLLAYRTGALTDADLSHCYEVAAHEGAALLGLPRADLRVGDPADFVLLPGESIAQAVVDRPIPRTVVRAGRIVARDGTLCLTEEIT